MTEWTIHNGDCLEVMRGMADGCVDSIVTDPPYGLSFMGKDWDYDVPSVEIWREALRVLKPGGHLLAFAGTRTQHRMACNIENAGFHIRDMICWVYGNGFPKSLDVSKAIDKMLGAEWEVVRIPSKAARNRSVSGGGRDGTEGATRPWIEKAMQTGYHEKAGDTPETPEAHQWDGWGTALKPSLEPVTVARKPLIGTVAENVLKHGTGALNIDGCRVEAEVATGWGGNPSRGYSGGLDQPNGSPRPVLGRWPSNFIHDGSDEAAYPLGEAARYFYVPKASSEERGPKNNHPTVKPVDLMRYLCRLVTKPGGTVLDPFAGSGTTIVAATMEGFNAIGIELSKEYVELIRERMLTVTPSLF
jgi:DNA modification methylase